MMYLNVGQSPHGLPGEHSAGCTVSMVIADAAATILLSAGKPRT